MASVVAEFAKNFDCLAIPHFHDSESHATITLKVLATTLHEHAMPSHYSVWMLLCLAMSLGCSPAGSQDTADRRDPSPRLSAVDLFRLHCSSCHGDGSGNGHVAATLKVRPRNLSLTEWQTSVDDQHIARVIINGGAAVKLSPEMPAFKEKLNAQEVHLLVYYLRKLGQMH